MVNERVVPVFDQSPLHLHERDGRGQAAFATKDPTSTIYNESGYQFGDTTFGDINSLNLFDLKADLLLKLEMLLNPNININTQNKINFINQLLPSWFQFSDDEAGTHGVSVFADVLLNILLENLPTSDPGGGLVWLSAT